MVPAPRKLTQQLNECDVEQIGRAYQAGASARQLADRYRMARTALLDLLRSRGVPIRYPRFSPAEVQEIVNLYRSGVRQIDIAHRLGRSKGAVWHLLDRLSEL